MAGGDGIQQRLQQAGFQDVQVIDGAHLVRGQLEDKSVFALASGEAWREARFGGDVETTGSIGTTPGGVEHGTADAPQPEPQQ